jgi:hypothetical protein
MSIKYYQDGKAISERKAFTIICAGYFNAGYSCPDELKALWESRSESEESREQIFELSGYELEIEIDD